MSERDRTKAVVVVIDGDRREAVLGRLVGVPLDLALVDALAGLQLEARRLGCSIVLRSPCQELSELLDLVGLADLVSDRLILEAEREPEGGEQLGVQEVVEPGDPPV